MVNVVIYARFSSSKQNETSIEAQLKECYDFCRKNEYIVINEYIDRALTGTNDNRKEFQKMIEDSNKKEFERYRRVCPRPFCEISRRFRPLQT